VTITTVGYRDYDPVTLGSRITAMFIMVAGVGIIGVLASLVSNMLIGRFAAPGDEEISNTPLSPKVEQDLERLANELAELRK
jgi:voltage-gated potassium channel